MPKYINPNNSQVTLDLGNPSRRKVTLNPYGAKKVEDQAVHRVVEMSAEKAAFFKSIGMIVELSKDAPEFKDEADVNVGEIEAKALNALAGRAAMQSRDAMTAASKLQESQRAEAEVTRKAKEAEELAKAEEERKAIEEAVKRREAQEEAEKGVVTQPGGTGPTTPVIPPHDPVTPIIPAVNPAPVAPIVPKAPSAPKTPVTTLPPGSKMPEDVGVGSDSLVDSDAE